MVPSLSADSTADYKASFCLNSNTTISSYMGEESASQLSFAAITAIHQSVEAELLAAQLMDDIKVW